MTCLTRFLVVSASYIRRSRSTSQRCKRRSGGVSDVATAPFPCPLLTMRGVDKES